MKASIKIFLFLLPVLSVAQQSHPDSLQKIFLFSKDDSVLYKAANQMYDYYEEVNRDSALFYADQGVQISHRNNKKLNEAHILTRKAYQEINKGRYAVALQNLLGSFAISETKTNEKSYWDVGTLQVEKEKRLFALNCAHHIYGILMRETMNHAQALVHFKEAKRIAVEINSYPRSLLASLNLGRIYMEEGKLDSALYYENEAVSIVKSSGVEKYLSTILYYTGKIKLNKGDTIHAIPLFQQSVESAIKQNNTDALTRGYHGLANCYSNQKHKDSSLYYAVQSVDAIRKLGKITQIEYHLGDAYEGLYQAYLLNHQRDSAYKYLALAQVISDSINQQRIKSLAEFQSLNLEEQQRVQKIENERVVYQNKVKTYFMLTGIGILLLLAIIFYRNNRQKQKAKIKIEQAYDHLKATQQQLIQSEKMASLGELTAGIAHEIQNPLNFVNNFSEVSNELIDEVQEERIKPRETRSEQIENELLIHIKENLNKINQHGKRADAIVKSMLQHSQKSVGIKESTDINALSEEYLRLAFHSYKLKNEGFECEIKMKLDSSLPQINVIRHDIGRVLLNLFNNAFWACAERGRLELGDRNLPTGQAGSENANFDPASLANRLPSSDFHSPISVLPYVTLTTKNLGDHLEIRIRDNGPGIPPNIIDKIFQPFFTTKPTGQGTGLGLSLAYDMIKAHGGNMHVTSNKGEGSEFVIKLPFKANQI